MQHPILRPGPEPALRPFRPEPDELGLRPEERNVTDRAHESLFEAITRRIEYLELYAVVAEGLRRQMAESKVGTARTVSSDAVCERPDLPGCESLFDESGGHRPREVDPTLRDRGDNENAADRITRRVEGRVIVRPGSRHLIGRELRRARPSLRR